MNKIDEPTNWHLKLFKKSLLKQDKLKAISSFLDIVDDRRCLDIGGDNGVISYYLRREGGQWWSADLEDEAVDSIRSLVKERVFKIADGKIPFEDNFFDMVVIVDFLEHIPGEREFIDELWRVLGEEGTLIINVPYVKRFSLLRGIRNVLGLTDEKHGHLRPGYTFNSLNALLKDRFEVERYKTYSGFFAELTDTLIAFAYENIGKGKNKKSKKGVLIDEDAFRKNKKTFKLYSLIYPIIWLVSRLDYLLFFLKGYKLILKAKRMEKGNRLAIKSIVGV